MAYGITAEFMNTHRTAVPSFPCFLENLGNGSIWLWMPGALQPAPVNPGSGAWPLNTAWSHVQRHLNKVIRAELSEITPALITRHTARMCPAGVWELRCTLRWQGLAWSVYLFLGPDDTGSHPGSLEHARPCTDR